ncbi:MAG: polymer-forming cytoskeletal protein [Deltaproteobacteria bacterium]|nr:polymer-forming cytoskeletal protein [Deltaproteobacteria bacterium]MBW2649091.1 polymer-forming cytoskeletal protein [Deltaproteobacteria bacterium]
MKEKDKNISIINKGCSLNGNLDFKGYLIVTGTVEGVLNAESAIMEEGSVVKADVTSEKLTIAGKFEGNIIVSGTLTLLGTSNVRGTIQCGNLIVEEGGILNSKISPLP